MKFYVIGRGPTDDIQSIAARDPDIIVTGQVDDVRDYLGKVSVLVTPIRLGKGFRGKILEAMAMGRFDVQSSIEQEITKRLNASNVGPLGLGGGTTAFATFLRVGPQRASGVRIVCLRLCCCVEPRVASVLL